LEVQGHDIVIARLDRQLDSLPAKQQLETATGAVALAFEELATAKAELSDVKRELTLVEDEVTKVEARRRRDIERLESGGAQSRELQALTHEVEALERRRDSLEDSQLEVMERLEQAQGAVGKRTLAWEGLTRRQGELEDQVAAESAQIAAARELEVAARAAVAGVLDPDLMALYERIRARQSGVGAAGLVRRRCEGCSMELNPAEIDQYRAAAPDDVVRCEECGRILVRGEDTGL
jgi:predicted  nucleic acid-binding Zn-ribbon protein